MGEQFHGNRENLPGVHLGGGGLHAQQRGRRCLGDVFWGVVAVCIEHSKNDGIAADFPVANHGLEGWHSESAGHSRCDLIGERGGFAGNAAYDVDGFCTVDKREGQIAGGGGLLHGGGNAVFANEGEGGALAEVDRGWFQRRRESGSERAGGQCQKTEEDPCHYQSFFGRRMRRPGRPCSASIALRGFSSVFKASSKRSAWRSVSSNSGGSSPSLRSSSAG